MVHTNENHKDKINLLSGWNIVVTWNIYKGKSCFGTFDFKFNILNLLWQFYFYTKTLKDKVTLILNDEGIRGSSWNYKNFGAKNTKLKNDLTYVFIGTMIFTLK